MRAGRLLRDNWRDERLGVKTVARPRREVIEELLGQAREAELTEAIEVFERMLEQEGSEPQ
jgi:hypothetical protein